MGLQSTDLICQMPVIAYPLHTFMLGNFVVVVVARGFLLLNTA